MKTITKISAALLVSALAIPAFAQNAPDRIVLESKAGSVMTSTGGDYATAPLGKALTTGESMMLTEMHKEEAREYREKNLQALEAKLEKYKEIPRERADVNQPRVGVDMRNG